MRVKAMNVKAKERGVVLGREEKILWVRLLMHFTMN